MSDLFDDDEYDDDDDDVVVAVAVLPNPDSAPSKAPVSLLPVLLLLLLLLLLGTSISFPTIVHAWIPPSRPELTIKSFFTAIANGPFPSCPSYKACKQFDNPNGTTVSLLLSLFSFLSKVSNSVTSPVDACTDSRQSISSPLSKSPKYKFPREVPHTTMGYKSIAIRRIQSSSNDNRTVLTQLASLQLCFKRSFSIFSSSFCSFCCLCRCCFSV
mmetsp:Transcript_47183/g.53318  ORF Transcript_47183/g.53318 Transcript_47183/m.53318 type:complete len:214 (+) Transcript_47183:251-892(+)